MHGGKAGRVVSMTRKEWWWQELGHWKSRMKDESFEFWLF